MIDIQEEGYNIILPEAYHELNTPARGYLEGVEVRFANGETSELTFLDPHNNENYRYYFEGQNVIIVDEVTAENIRSAVRRLSIEGRLRSQ